VGLSLSLKLLLESGLSAGFKLKLETLALTILQTWVGYTTITLPF